jgi:PRTRC genetic system protein B
MQPYYRNAMNDLTNNFGALYHPVKALLLYQRTDGQNQASNYVESYDMDKDGCPINGHPLSIKEANALAKSLLIAEKKQRNFLNPTDILSPDVIFLKTGNDGFAIWQTPPKRVKLLFTENLDIPSGEANIPALLWKAGKNSLSIFAVQDEKVKADTPLHHAPFFNIYADGKVCMGNVAIKIPNDCSLEAFMNLWEDYFFNSYFSHLFGQHVPVKGNIVQLWRKLINSKMPFPPEKLIPNHIPINKLIK